MSLSTMSLDQPSRRCRCRGGGIPLDSVDSDTEGKVLGEGEVGSIRTNIFTGFIGGTIVGCIYTLSAT